RSLFARWAWANRANNDLDAAVTAYRNAIALNPNLSAAHDNLGVALYQKEDFDGAVVAFTEAIRLDPKNPSHQQALDLALKRKAEREGKVAPPPREVKR